MDYLCDACLYLKSLQDKLLKVKDDNSMCKNNSATLRIESRPLGLHSRKRHSLGTSCGFNRVDALNYK